MKPKVLVVGLDGATWDVLLPMIDKLPNLAGLLRKGAYGRLESCIPPVTTPAWKCYSTGKNPGRLGVFYHVEIDFATGRQALVDSRSFHGLDIWDYMGAEGQRVAIISMPTTFPPKPVNGIMVSGPYSDNSGYTYPPELESSLRARGWRIFADELLMADRKEDCVDQVIEVMRSRFELAKEVVVEHNVDFLHVTVFHIDTIQHFLWGTPEMERAWVAIDRFLGELLEVIPQGCHVVLMSDHGFEETRETFYISTWLRNEGYLTLRPSIKVVDWMARMGITSHRIYRILKATGLIDIVRKLPKGLLRTIGYALPMEGGIVQSESLGYMADLRRSQVVPIGVTVFLNPCFENRDAVIEELVQRLKQLRFPGEDEPFVLDVLRREDIYSGDYVDKAFDLFVLARPNVFVSHRLKQDPDPFGPKDSTFKAHHNFDGIFLISGPSASYGRRLDGVKLVDLAPTIMHLMELEIPNDMDGRVILEAFDGDSSVAKRKPRYRSVDGSSVAGRGDGPASERQDEDAVMERLRRMGYIE